MFAGLKLDGCDVTGHHGGSECLPSRPPGSGTSSQSFFRAKWHESANGGGALPEVRWGAWRQMDAGCVQRAYSTTSPGMTRIQRHSLREAGCIHSSTLSPLHRCAASPLGEQLVQCPGALSSAEPQTVATRPPCGWRSRAVRSGNPPANSPASCIGACCCRNRRLAVARWVPSLGFPMA